MKLRAVTLLIFGALAFSLAFSSSSFADSALQPGSVDSFESVFGTEQQRILKEAQEMLEKSGARATPFLLDFVEVPTSDLAVQNFLYWSTVALDTSGRDHVPVFEDPDAKCKRLITYQQLGPHRASRAMAIVHLAMFDAVNAVSQQYTSYSGVADFDSTGLDRGQLLYTAVAYAAHDTLVALFTSQKSSISIKLGQNLLGENPATVAGKKLGQAAAAAILAKRKDDGANEGNVEGMPAKEPVLVLDDCNPNAQVFQFKGADLQFWHQDPVSRLNVALGANWGSVRPFALKSGDQFRVPEINIADPKWASHIQEILDIGGAGVDLHGAKSATKRRPGDTIRGVFWAYDGVPSLCAPPTLYNQIIRSLLKNDPRRNDISFVSQIFALANMSMADAGIAAWESKFHHQVARPVSYIRDSDGGATDGALCNGSDPQCQKACLINSDAKWCALGAPATNGKGPNFTPPFPAYPSGHATFGGALFQVLRTAWPDKTAFTFTSDEFNGSNKPAGSSENRPILPLSWGALSEAERENADSRLWLGVHWRIDADAGIAQGHCVADWAASHELLPRNSTKPAEPTCDYSSIVN